MAGVNSRTGAGCPARGLGSVAERFRTVLAVRDLAAAERRGRAGCRWLADGGRDLRPSPARSGAAITACNGWKRCFFYPESR